jgi:hypothetical protein
MDFRKMTGELRAGGGNGGNGSRWRGIKNNGKMHPFVVAFRKNAGSSRDI